MSKQEDIQYRFSGYNLPMIKLDETGYAYYQVEVHPYFYNQPLYWQKPCYNGTYLNTSPRNAAAVNSESSSSGANIQGGVDQMYHLLPIY